MQTYVYGQLSAAKRRGLCTRAAADLSELRSLMEEMQSRISKAGDTALREYTSKFDGAEMTSFRVSQAEMSNAEANLPSELKAAIRIAAANIEKYHSYKELAPEKIETSTGITCWREPRAIESVGLYIPGGSAPLFSTLLMLAIPAKAAGCENIVVCTPPRKDGTIAPEILFAAQLLGLKQVYKLGGAQAIFALAQGTDSIPKVDKIFGPGNAFVTAAKSLVSSKVAIDMPAGPSEVLVIADNNASPIFVASDLLAQAEHGPDSQTVLVTDSAAFAKAVSIEIEAQLMNLPRADIARKSIGNSFTVLTDTLKQAVDFSNLYAPEHLILGLESYDAYLPMIKNAGSVFCGSLSCESFGDYASGPNHVLPTAGFAKSFSGVSTASFQKMVSFQHVSQAGCQMLGPTVEILAEAEGLQAHKNAVSVRLAAIGGA